MKVLVIGSGGREHALVWKIAQSPLVGKVFAAPGNAGIAAQAECVQISVEDQRGLLEFAVENGIGLTVVGPELPLAQGIVDTFKQSGQKIFGPQKAAARLEASKVFAKELMAESNVPTARFKVFDRVDEAKRFIRGGAPPFIIKADGLAAGKGVLIAPSSDEAAEIAEQMIGGRMFGDAGARIVIEERLEGEELSILLFTDGDRILPLASAQDHKRAYDGDQGPNTGGMGAYSPCPLVSNEELEAIVAQTASPVIETLRQRGTPYQGILYVGLMMTAAGPRVLEYNVRFGDPEAQAVLPRLKTDIVPIMLQIAEGKLRTEVLEWDARACLTVVVASGGYPGNYKNGCEITGLENVAGDDAMIFHAGTASDTQGRVITSGGRVLAVSALGTSLKDAYEAAYRVAHKISFHGSFYRKDIGRRAFERLKVRSS